MTESSTATVQPALTRDETGTLVGQTFGLVAATAGLFALGAYLGRDLSYGWGWALFLPALACLIALNFAAQRSEGLAIGLLFAFGALIGFATAPTIAYYASTNPKVVWQAGGATALFIAGFGAAGYATRRDLAPLARALFWALIGLIIFGIVAIFVGPRDRRAGDLRRPDGLRLQRLRRAKDIRAAPYSPLRSSWTP